MRGEKGGGGRGAEKGGRKDDQMIRFTLPLSNGQH